TATYVGPASTTQRTRSRGAISAADPLSRERTGRPERAGWDAGNGAGPSPKGQELPDGSSPPTPTRQPYHGRLCQPCVCRNLSAANPEGSTASLSEKPFGRAGDIRCR